MTRPSDPVPDPPSAVPPGDTPDDLVEDARGLLCPLPVVRLDARIRTAPPGAVVRLLADDPAAEEDVRMWCRGHGHALESVEREGREVRLRVRRKAG